MKVSSTHHVTKKGVVKKNPSSLRKKFNPGDYDSAAWELSDMNYSPQKSVVIIKKYYLLNERDLNDLVGFLKKAHKVSVADEALIRKQIGLKSLRERKQ